MRDEAGVDHGPVVGIGPFTPNGEPEWPAVLMAWNETEREEQDVNPEHEPTLASVEDVVVAVLALVPGADGRAS